MQCSAIVYKTGEQCKRRAVTGMKVCQVHGGATPRGIASPHYKTGRYSKVLPTRLAARYAEAEHDPQLLELRSEISLTDARLADLLVRVDSGESGALWQALLTARGDLLLARKAGNAKEQADALNTIIELISKGHADYRAWSEIAAVLEQRRRLVESERKRLTEAQQTLTIEKAMLLIGAIGGIIKAHVTDVTTLRKISADISALTTYNPSE
jgi:Flp pilus assembly protein TadD